MIGTRDSAKLSGWLRHAGPGAPVGTFSETAQFGDVVVLSVLGSAAEEVIRPAGVENLAGKIVIDASDPLDFSSGRPGLFVGTTDSRRTHPAGWFATRTSSRALTSPKADVMINPSLTGDEPIV
jgi:8-hydroxy-5-deazaflavin:NADPH oxidoreductase